MGLIAPLWVQVPLGVPISMKTFLIGDIHGNLNTIKSLLKEYAEKGDTLIQVGDFGAGRLHKKKIKSLDNKLSKAGCKLLVVRGNHDDPSWFKGNNLYGSITFLNDTTKIIGEKKFLFLGGAVSVDRYFREIYNTWWPGEEYKYDEAFLSRLSDVDYVVSHTCPTFAKPHATTKNDLFLKQFTNNDSLLLEDLAKEGKDMELSYNKLKEKNKIKAWYFGHFHTSSNVMYDSTKFRCLNIDEVVMV